MKITVYDPTASDVQSKVRGIGRYLQTLRELLPPDALFVSRVEEVPYDSVFLNPFFNLLQPPLTNKRVAMKQAAVIHDVIPLQFPAQFPIGLRGKLNVWRNKKILNTYDLVITDSETSKEHIAQHLRIDRSRIEVVYPTIHSTFSSVVKKKPVKDPYFIYVGDVTWNKNLLVLARAIQQQKLPCVFVGRVFQKGTPQSSWTKEFDRFMEIAGHDDRFIFPGFVSDEELLQLYRGAVANILISREEGFGFSYFEAASQKTPSILSDISIFHETAGDTGIFVNPQNADDVSTVLTSIAGNTKRRTMIGQKAYARFRSFVASPHPLTDRLTRLSSGQ